MRVVSAVEGVMEGLTAYVKFSIVNRLIENDHPFRIVRGGCDRELFFCL